MYLALLAGGQIIKKIVKKTLGLSGDDGMALFDFSQVNRSELRKEFCSTINGLNLSRREKDDIVSEKVLIFKMNNAIVNSIQPQWSSYLRLAKLFTIFVAVPLAMALFYLYNH